MFNVCCLACERVPGSIEVLPDESDFLKQESSGQITQTTAECEGSAELVEFNSCSGAGGGAAASAERRELLRAGVFSAPARAVGPKRRSCPPTCVHALLAVGGLLGRRRGGQPARVEPELGQEVRPMPEPCEAPSINELTGLLLEEDRLIFEFDQRREEAARGCLARLRWRLDEELPLAQRSEHTARFCSDETLLRYLSNCDSNLDKALSMLQATLEWRSCRSSQGATPTGGAWAGLGASLDPCCPRCLKDPREHGFMRVGQDAVGRHVIYSCSGRASNKSGVEGVTHIALELDRVFRGGSVKGRAVWLVDFAGLGVADCDPRTALSAVSMLSNHFPETWSQIVLFGLPTLFLGMYNLLMRLVDPVIRRRVVILKDEAAQKRYARTYWGNDPAMAAWLEAAFKCEGAPGCYPSLQLSRGLRDASTVALLERCADLAAAQRGGRG